MPAHAFWGLLAKAGSKAATAGKVAGTAGKGAVVGAAAAEGTTAGMAGKGAFSLADDAAQAGARSVPELSHVNAALPPEVAAYLNKPAQSLSAKDTAHMMDSYHRMVAQAGRSGDFTGIERTATSGPARKLDAAAPAASAASGRAPAAVAHETPPMAVRLDALHLLVHASHAGNREAQAELDRLCAANRAARKNTPPSAGTSNEFDQTCLLRTASRLSKTPATTAGTSR